MNDLIDEIFMWMHMLMNYYMNVYIDELWYEMYMLKWYDDYMMLQ